MSLDKEINIFGRHTVRSDGPMGRGELERGDKALEGSPAITEKGEEVVRELVNKEYKKIIETMDDDGILFLGGSSEEERTKTTSEITGDELSKIYEEDKDVIVFSKKRLEEMREENDSKFLDEIKSIIESNADKKIVFTYPLFLKEFSIRPHFREKETGEHTKYSKELLKKNKYQEEKAGIEWFAGEGAIDSKDGEIKVSSPQEVANDHIKGINRLRDFAKKIVDDRQVCLGITGHGWNLDALALYYANNGEVDAEALKSKFDNKLIEQAEIGWVEIKDNKNTLHYKDKDFESEG